MEIITNINYSDLIECEKLGKISLPIYFSKNELQELSNNKKINIFICKLNNILVGFFNK